MTSVRADRALGFYRRTGRHQVTHPAPEGRAAVVFLPPLHPAVTEKGAREDPPRERPSLFRPQVKV